MSQAAPSSAPAERLTPVGTVLVTGGASGLGAAVIAAVHAAGGTPLCLDRDKPAADAVPAEWIEVDLADARSAEQVVARLAATTPLDAVVTCAGTDSVGELDQVDGAAWDRVVLVNLLGTAAVVRAALPTLQARRGRVVTVASTLALRALPGATAYCASKFGVLGFSRALAVEQAGRVGVTTLIPGGMRTHFFDDRPDSYKPAADQALNDPGDVARAVLFALRQPPGVELRELVIAPAVEPSWP